MSRQDKSKSKAHNDEVEAHAETNETAEDNYEPQIEGTLREDFENDSRFTKMSVNVFRLEPKGMAMETYVPILIGSYPVPNRKH